MRINKNSRRNFYTFSYKCSSKEEWKGIEEIIKTAVYLRLTPVEQINSIRN